MTSKERDLMLQNIIDMLSKEKGGVFGNFSRTASVTEVGNISDEEANRYFDTLFYSPNGLQRVAMAMQEPLKIMLDYHGIGRKLLKIDPIPPVSYTHLTLPTTPYV